MKTSTQQALKDARAMAQNLGHDLHPFQPLYGSLANGTSTACRNCGRKVSIQIKRSGPIIDGLAITERCEPGSVKS